MTARARGLAVLGTASNVGKSLIATALGRLLSDAGVRVAPFKAQNMALAAGVTAAGGEMGRAQILQARACRVEPHVDMNPVLIKPRSDTGAELVVLGRAQGSFEARGYFRPGNPLAEVADAALDRLAAHHDVIVLEGAGSPVELNLMDRDFVNLRPARRLAAAIVLVADIDGGGVFAQVKGTLDLLPPEDRARVVGVVVNRFRGDLSLFEPGIGTLEAIAGVPVLAVVPHVAHGLDEEDRPYNLPVDAEPRPGRLNVAVVLHPHVANTDDLAPFEAEPDVAATWVTDSRRLAGRELVVLPGTKATIADLAHHTATGMTEAIVAAARRGTFLLGLCGGYQMLGGTLADPLETDGNVSQWPGLGLLPVTTTFARDKETSLRRATSRWPTGGLALDGYEIHHGRTDLVAGGEAEALAVEDGAALGLVAGRVVGTYLHGLLRSDGWRAAFLDRVRRAHGLPPQPPTVAVPSEVRIDRWARHVASALRPGAWERIRAAIT